jgi:hypothetical protein
MKIEEVKYQLEWRNSDDDDKCLMLIWDDDDDETNDIMEEEFRFISHYKNKKNMMWLNDIRKMTGIKGNIYLFFKQNCDGCVYIWVRNYDDDYMNYISNICYWDVVYSEYHIKCSEIFYCNKEQTYNKRVVIPNCVYQNKKKCLKIVDSFNKK